MVIVQLDGRYMGVCYLSCILLYVQNNPYSIKKENKEHNKIENVKKRLIQDRSSLWNNGKGSVRRRIYRGSSCINKLAWHVLVTLFFIPYELIAYLLLFVAVRRCRP